MGELGRTEEGKRFVASLCFLFYFILFLDFQFLFHPGKQTWVSTPTSSRTSSAPLGVFLGRHRLGELSAGFSASASKSFDFYSNYTVSCSSSVLEGGQGVRRDSLVDGALEGRESRKLSLCFRLPPSHTNFRMLLPPPYFCWR